MPDKITSAIKKMLGKNERAAGRAKKKKFIEGPAEAISDSMSTEDELIRKEMKRRKGFAEKGPRTMPRPATKKKKVKA